MVVMMLQNSKCPSPSPKIKAPPPPPPQNGSICNYVPIPPLRLVSLGAADISSPEPAFGGRYFIYGNYYVLTFYFDKYVPTFYFDKYVPKFFLKSLCPQYYSVTLLP